MSTRLALACATLAAVVLTAAAGDQPASRATTPEPSTLARPTTASAPEQATGEQATGAPECDPRASLRPQGPLPAPGRIPAGSTMARIAERGFLIAGVDRAVHQFSFQDENLRLTGFDIDIARDIAEAILGDRERVVFRQADVVDRIPLARSGQADLVIATTTVTCKRWKEVDFSAVYYVAGQRVLVNRDSAATGLDDLGGRRVCAARGSTSMGTLLAARPKLITVGEATTTDCLVLLQLGEIEAVSTDDTLLASMVAQDPQTKIVGPRRTEEPYGIAISKDTPDLVRFVNAVLERRTQDGRWLAGYQRWLAEIIAGPPPDPPAPRYRD